MSPQNSIVCDLCLSLDLDDEIVGTHLRIVLSDLRHSASKPVAACPTCVILWQAVCEFTQPEAARPDIAFESIYIDSKPPAASGPMVVHINPDPVAWGMTTRTLQFYTTVDDTPSPWKLVGNGHHIAENGLSEGCLALAQHWLEMCTHARGKHVNCSTISVPELPTRVVFIGKRDKPPCLEAGDHRRAHYAALSHCWGGTTPVMTTTANINEYSASLPLDLPNTFQDAISVARALDIQYIWIDSLCIIQDSTEDWLREASRMARIYSNAYVTISSDAAADSSAGFLGVPSRQAPHKMTIKYTKSQSAVDQTSLGLIHIRRRGFLAEELPFHSWTTERGDSGRSKLASRGWVFQERLLSPRTLHFSRNEMAWECRSVCECECSATSLRPVRNTSVIKHFLHPRQVNSKLVESSWRNDVVPAFTQLELTFATDRLPAIAGLAEEFGKLRSGDEYLAGLWLKSIKADLLWHVTPISRGSARIPGKGTPTWSWGSVTGPVTYNLKHEVGDIGLSVLNIVPAGENSQALRISGHLLSVSLHNTWSDQDSVARPRSDINLAIICDFHGGTDKYPSNYDYYFLMFGSSKRGNGPFGLLLSSCLEPGSDEAYFQRVGYIEGYRHARRLRRWNSGGWDFEENENLLESSRDENDETAVATQIREKWVGEVLSGETKLLTLL